MKLALIGVGQAGGKITEAFLDYTTDTGADIVIDAIAINSAEADLMGLSKIPEDKRVLVGESQVKGHGVGADNELGAEVMEQDIDEVSSTLDQIPVHKIDAFLVVAALGGGTGSGGAPVVARHLRTMYDEPVYGLGILPSQNEGSIYTLNAARSFQTFVREVDNLLVFDNDAWRQSGESVTGAYSTINNEIATQFGTIFSAGEITNPDYVGESVVDSSEIINTLSTGGVSTIGQASDTVEIETGLLSRFTSGDQEHNEVEVTNRITTLVRKAARGRLTLPCEVSSAESALVVVSGPPKYLNRKGIEEARTWVEEETESMQIRGGDNPRDSDQVSGTVLMSGVTDVPRIKQLQQVAIEAQDHQAELADNRDDELEALVDSGTDDDIDPLF